MSKKVQYIDILLCVWIWLLTTHTWHSQINAEKRRSHMKSWFWNYYITRSMFSAVTNKSKAQYYRRWVGYVDETEVARRCMRWKERIFRTRSLCPLGASRRTNGANRKKSKQKRYEGLASPRDSIFAWNVPLKESWLGRQSALGSNLVIMCILNVQLFQKYRDENRFVLETVSLTNYYRAECRTWNFSLF